MLGHQFWDFDFGSVHFGGVLMCWHEFRMVILVVFNFEVIDFGIFDFRFRCVKFWLLVLGC